MKSVNLDNPVRRLRLALNMNQVELGRIVGKSYQTVRNYETGIGNVPDSVIETLKNLAAEKGFAHLALELSSEDWKVRTIVHPPQEFARYQARLPNAAVDAGRQARHALIDALLDSGNEDAILAVEHLLRYFTTTLAATPKPTPKPVVKPAAKAAGQRHPKT